MPIMKTIISARAADLRRVAAFFGRELRRTETRFCARRNGDSCSTSRSSSRASSISSRANSSLGGYNSSCEMVGLLFRAINSGHVVRESLSENTITSFGELRQKKIGGFAQKANKQ